MKNIRLFVYVLLCNLFLLEFNELSASTNNTASPDSTQHLLAQYLKEATDCPTSPPRNIIVAQYITKIEDKENKNTFNQLIPHGTSTPDLTKKRFPSSPSLADMPSCSSLTRLVFGRENSFNPDNIATDQGRKALTSLDSNLNLHLNDCETTPPNITEKK